MAGKGTKAAINPETYSAAKIINASESLKIPETPKLHPRSGMEPPPLFPPFKDIPNPPPMSTKSQYLVAKSAYLKQRFQSSVYYLAPPPPKQAIQRYSDKYLPPPAQDALFQYIDVTSGLFPLCVIPDKIKRELKLVPPKRKSDQDGGTLTKKQKPKDVDRLKASEQKEEKEEKSDKKKDKEEKEEQLEPIVQEEEEEEFGDDDYVTNYNFEDGDDDWGNEEDRGDGDEEPTF